MRYAKRGRLRFSSTRDFQRALERAVRRAGVPMAFSAGFHPHPRISYANAAPTGAASEAEYFQLQLTQQCDLEALRAALDESLPQDMAVLRVVEAAPGALADLLQASVWQLDFEGVTLKTITDAVATFMDRAELLVTRMTKSGAREFDVRQAVLASDVVLVRAGDADGRDLVRWTMTIQHTTRLAQGVLEADGRVIDPFDA